MNIRNHSWLAFTRPASPLRKPALAAILLTGLFALGMGLPTVALFENQENFLPVHTLLEFVAISISAMIFSLGWNIRNEKGAGSLPILGGVFLSVALIDLAHTLSYEGLPALITPNSLEKAINFWLAGRFIATAGLLALAFLPMHRTLPRHFTHASVLLGLVITGIILYIGLYRTEWLPHTFIPGLGLTLFKVITEYCLAVACWISVWQFARRARIGKDVVSAWMAAAAWTLGLGEVFFSHFQTIIDQANLFGHIFKATGYLMIYRALFVAGVRRPYAQLSNARAALQSMLQEMVVASAAFETHDGIVITDNNKTALRINQAYTRITGYSSEDVVGTIPPIFKSDQHDVEFYQAMSKALVQDKCWAGEVWSNRKSGEIYPMWLTVTAITAQDGSIGQYVGTFFDMSDFKRSERELRLTQTAIDNSRSAFFRLSPEGTVLYVNDHACQSLGYRRGELIGQHVWDFDPDFPPEAWPPFWTQLKQTGRVALETRHRRKDGTIFPVEVTANYILSDGDEYNFVFVQDISERKQAEAELRVAATVFETQEGIIVTDANKIILRINRAFTRITGYSMEDLAGTTPSIFQSGRHDASFYQAMWEALSHDKFWTGEIWDKRKNGEEYPLWLTITVVSTSDEHIDYYVATFSDLSAYKRLEQERQQLAIYNQSLIEAIPDAVFFKDAQSRWQIVNQAAKQLFGLQDIAWRGKTDVDLAAIQPESRATYELCHELDERAWHDGKLIVADHQLIDAQGRAREFEMRKAPIFGDSGARVGVVTISRDITEHKRAEAELKQHRDHLQELVVEQTKELRLREATARRALLAFEHQKAALDQHSIVAVTDVQGRITYVNRKFCDISGYSQEELIGQDHALLNSGHHPHGFFKEMYRTVAKGQPWHAEVCNRAKDGHLYWVDTTIAPFMDEDGKPVEYISIRNDITERKRAEEAAEAANRAKSEFLANMSHEIRTPMNGVVGMVDILQESALSREQRRMVRTIRDSSLSLLHILDDILDYSKIEAGKLSIESIPVYLREVMEGVAQLTIPSTAAKGVDLYVFVSPDLPVWIVSDPVRLRQILFNLLSNAVKFTSSHADQRAQVMLRAESVIHADGHPGLRLRVIDNGIGMSPEVIASLFHPFTQADESTTRHFGGTGLGLSITKRLVEMLHGQISVRSASGGGSEFIVELPLETSQPGHPLVAEPELAGVRVLAVTDDAEYAEILPVYLRAAGAEVTVVADAEAALQCMRQSGRSWVVLLLDPQAAPIQSVMNESGLADTVRVVQLIRRRSSGSDARGITVPVNPLLYQDLIHGVAVASGRLSIHSGTAKIERHQQSRIKTLSVDEAMAANRLILLAEDNETNREVIQEQIHLLGYAVEMAVDGREALQRWRSGRYALLLTDCHMPKMDGFQLTAAIRAEEPQGKRFPIVAVTANAMQGEAERCLENDMDDYLSKPVRLDELGPMLAKWLPLSEEQQEASGAGQEPTDIPAHAAVIWDASALSRLMGGDPDMHRRLLDKFLVSAEEQVAAIGIAGNPAVVADVAHKLKSAARTVGAMLLGDLCQELETVGRAGNTEAIPALVELLNAAFSAAAELIKKR